MAKTEQNSPPSGTGNLPGLGEAFSINLSTGQGTYSYQIPLPDGVAKHTPKLVLEYNHGAGHGPWGLGWRLSLRSISRRLDFGTPDQSPVERFLDTGAEIVPADDGTFRAMRETMFTRYSRIGAGWKIEERTGLVHELGTAPTSRVAHPAHPDRAVEWLVDRTTDVSGNAIAYRYRFDQGIAYPEAIRYAIYEVRFEYENRPDVRHDGRAGFSRRRALRCTAIRLVLDPETPEERVIRTYQYVYATAPGSGVSLLREIRLTANGAAADGSNDVVRPPVRFEYSTFDPTRFEIKWMSADAGLPPDLTDEDTALVTLDDAPLPGVLQNVNGREYYWPNRGQGRWGAPHPLRAAPLASTFRREGLAFVDMDGSGTADLMVADPDARQGYYENGGRKGWLDFVAFPRGARATPQWSDKNLRLLDADGDGLIDAMTSTKKSFVWWRNRGRDGWSFPSLVPKGDAELRDVDLGDPDVHLADMTGDGSLDIVRVQSGRIDYWPSLGRGRFGAKITMHASPRLRRNVDSDTILLTDLDGDGCADLVILTDRGLTIYQNQNGSAFADPVVIPSVPSSIKGSVRAVNMTGRAGTGLVWNSHARRESGYVQFQFANATPPYLLSRIENGAGLVSEILYRSVVEDYLRDLARGIAWTTHFPFPYLVVAGTRETDRVTGRVVQVDFAYHEAHFERHTRQFQGFRQTERFERGDASRPDTRLVHHFVMAAETLPGNGREHAELNGMLARIETYELDGTPLERTPTRIETSEHGLTVLSRSVDGRARSFVFVSAHRIEDTERTDDSRVEEKTYTYDGTGNVVREVHRGSGVRDGTVQPVRERVTELEFAASNSHYLLDKTSRATVRDADGNLLSEKRFFYDGPDFIGLPGGQAGRGLVSREEELVLNQAEFDAHYAGMSQAQLGFSSSLNADGVPSVFAPTKQNRYDTRGLLTGTQDALGTETTYEFDGEGLTRVAIAEPLGKTQFTYDRATGQITRTVHADGAETRFAYDAQGRVLASAVPGQDLADPPTKYTYDETVIPNRRTAIFQQAGGATSVGVTYFDGYGNEFQQRVEVEPGQFLVSAHKAPNPWGDPREEFEPVFSPNADFAIEDTAGKPSRRFFYDSRGRVVRVANFNEGVSTAQYRPFGVILRDANDNDDSPENIARGQFDTPRVETFDVFRYLVAVTDQIGGGTEVTTGYEIGVMGELLSVSDRQGTKFRYRYDRRGNRLSISIRESGERRIWYDARKKPVRTVDAAGRDLRADWDATGRQTHLRSGADVLEEYTYDTPAQNALGRIASVRYSGGRQAFFYDKAGRVVRRHYEFDGVAGSRSLQYEYDALGRETAMIHEDGTRIERRLAFNGWVASVANAIDAVVHDPRGFPAEMLYANGVRTTSEFTSGPGRVKRQTSVSPGGEVYEQVEFAFDKMDLVLSRNDTAPGGTGLRTFRYDPLGQLTSSTSMENDNPVTRNYEYAPDYNLRRFDEARCTLHYDDPLHPDRLSGLTPDGGPAFAIDYDGNGNLQSLPGQQFQYNEKNELVRLSTAAGLIAEYSYDHLGMRVSRTVTPAGGPATRTLYLGDVAEIRDGVPAYFVNIGPVRVALFTGGSVRFLHHDGMGSTSFVTDAAGARIGRIDNHAFGNIASTTGNIDFRTYALHPVDPESGLVYMRRRYYAPQLGRFLTPDLMAIYQPEKFLHNPQGLHLYAYVGNDPLNKTDPTGLSFWSFVGAVAGVIVGVVVAIAIVAAVVATGGVLGVLLGIGLALGASLLVTGVSYVIASNVDPNSAFGQFMRGFMIGFNAGMNGVLAGAIFGPAVGIAVGVIGFLATFDGVAKSPVYQGILGWSSWLMPMSWGATGAGLIVFVFNLIMAGVTFQQWDAAKIDKIAIDWKTGSIVTVGGLVRGPTAFDMGNFIYMNPDYVDGSTPDRTYDAILAHETGHTLEVGAFGSAFLVMDFFGENVVGAGADDYGEKIAESHANRGGRNTIPMWG